MKKITFLFVLIFSLTSYASIKILSGYSIILPKNKEENLDKLDKLIEFYGDVENTSDENSYLKEIKLLEKITNPVKGIKLLETEIVIETNKKYILKNIDKSNCIKVYNQSYNPVTDTINAGARTKRLFSGTVEDYKKQKK